MLKRKGDDDGGLDRERVAVPSVGGSNIPPCRSSRAAVAPNPSPLAVEH